jgi:lipopolysaccharide/colanic/teichoic acid biosynthesis glycosyltransferase
MDISALADLIEQQPKLKIYQVKKVITNIVRESTRDIDIKSWHNDTTLKILMPGTPISGAHLLAEKLQQRINNSFRTFFDLENMLDTKKIMLITSYPEALKNSGEFSESKSSVAKKPVASSPLEGLNRGETTTILKMQWSPPNQMTQTWPLYSDLLEETAITNLQKWIKRAIDIIGALIGILLFSPLMFIIGILIKTTSPGPILFKQERKGFLGKKFTFLKFRSMYTGCDENRHKEYVTDLIKNSHKSANCSSDDRRLYKMEADPRITPFGKFLRRSSLDELPQLFNVLKADMSLVGPRPPIPYEVEKYEDWHLRRVLEVRPGITGLWQVKGRSVTTFNEMVRLDISYVNNRSLWLDFKIILETIWVVFSTRGAY